MNERAGGEPAQALGGPGGLEPASPIVMPGHAEPTIYDVDGCRGLRLRRFLEPCPSLAG